MIKTKKFKISLVLSIPDVGYIPVQSPNVEQLIKSAFYNYITIMNKSKIVEIKAEEVGS